MGVIGVISVIVEYLYKVSVATGISRKGYLSAVRRIYGRAARGAQINAKVIIVRAV